MSTLSKKNGWFRIQDWFLTNYGRTAHHLGIIYYVNFLERLCKGGFFSVGAMNFFQISKSQKQNIPKSYPEIEI